MSLEKRQYVPEDAIKLAVDQQSVEQKETDNEKVLKMIEAGQGWAAASNLDKFEGLNQEIAIKLLDAGQGWAVEDNLDKFEGLNQEIVIKLLDARQGRAVINNLDKFEGLNHQEIAIKMIETGQGFAVAKNLDKFEGLNHQEIVIKLLDTRQVSVVKNNLDKFEGLSVEFLRPLIKDMIMKEQIDLAIKVNEHFGDIDKALTRLVVDFGENISTEIYNIYKDLESGQIPDDAAELGVRHEGETGMNELKNKLRGLQKELINGKIDLQSILDYPLAGAWIRKVVRFEGSEWGKHDDDEFIKVVEAYIERRDNIQPLPPEYQPSEVLNIAKTDKEAQAEFQHSEDFLSRYGTLMRSIKEARALVDTEKPLNELLDFISQKRDVLVTQLEGKLVKQSNPKARENLGRRIEELKGIDLETISHPQEAFKTLSSFKGEFDEELRQAMFYFGFTLNQQQQEKFDEFEFNEQEPDLDELSWALNFVDHITNQETLSKFFTDKRAAKNFNGMLNTSALQQEMSRWQNQATKGTMPMKFVPSRDLLTEFSGHISDSCWASEYESILEEFPNFISLTMVQNPDHPKFEKLAGSCLLIETTNEQNEPLLVIRGLNPQENVINELDTNDYYEHLTEYLKPIAKKLERKLAIVIDDHSGGSATNRLALFKSLETMKQKLKAVKLKSNKDTKFNGYDIRSDCYLVE